MLVRSLVIFLAVAVWCGCGKGSASGAVGSGGIAAGTSGGSGGKTGATGGGGGNRAGSGGGGQTGGAGSGAADSGLDSSSKQARIEAILSGACAKSTVERELLPANILFVIDRSATMNCNPPPVTESAACEKDAKRADASSPSKWEITRDALIAAIEALPDSASAGVSYFSNDDTCGVNSTPSVPVELLSSAHRQLIETSLNAMQPNGGTPIVGAVILAYQHLHQEAKLTGNKFVVLLTDGQEACSPDQIDRLVDTEVPKALSVNIRTFVIGAPGSEGARVFLSRIAANGGTGNAGCKPDSGDCHFDMTAGANQDFAARLGDALTAISGRTLTCEFAVPTPEPGKEVDKNRLNVVYTPGNGGERKVINQAPDSDCDKGPEGWRYIQNDTKIELCGDICRTVKADAGGKIDVVLGCPVVIL